MGQFYEAKVKIEKLIEQKKLDPAQTKGALSLKCGVLLALIRPDTPDDAAKFRKLRDAARQLLGLDL